MTAMNNQKERMDALAAKVREARYAKQQHRELNGLRGSPKVSGHFDPAKAHRQGVTRTHDALSGERGWFDHGYGE